MTDFVKEAETMSASWVISHSTLNDRRSTPPLQGGSGIRGKENRKLHTFPPLPYLREFHTFPPLPDLSEFHTFPPLPYLSEFHPSPHLSEQMSSVRGLGNMSRRR